MQSNCEAVDHYAANNPVKYTDPDGNIFTCKIPSTKTTKVEMSRDDLKLFYRSVVVDYNEYKNENWLTKAADFFTKGKTIASASTSSEILMGIVTNAGKIGKATGKLLTAISKVDAAVSVYECFFPKSISKDEQIYNNFNKFYSELEALEAKGSVVSNIELKTIETYRKEKGLAGYVPFVQISKTTTTTIYAIIDDKKKEMILYKEDVPYKTFMNCTEL